MSIKSYLLAAEEFNCAVTELLALRNQDKLANLIAAAFRLQQKSSDCRDSAEVQDGAAVGTAICMTVQAIARTQPESLTNRLLAGAIAQLILVFARHVNRLKAAVGSKREEVDCL